MASNAALSSVSFVMPLIRYTFFEGLPLHTDGPLLAALSSTQGKPIRALGLENAKELIRGERNHAAHCNERAGAIGGDEGMRR
jgi:hypothetical protein